MTWVDDAIQGIVKYLEANLVGPEEYFGTITQPIGQAGPTGKYPGMTSVNPWAIGAGGAYFSTLGPTATGVGGLTAQEQQLMKGGIYSIPKGGGAPKFTGQVLAGAGGGGFWQSWPLKTLVIWNLMTDWVWIQNMLREMIGMETAPEKLKKSYIGLSDEIRDIGNRIIYAETEQDWEFVQQRMAAIDPMLGDFKTWAGEAEIKEYNDMLDMFETKMTEYQTQIQQATGAGAQTPAQQQVREELEVERERARYEKPWQEAEQGAFVEWLVSSGRWPDKPTAAKFAATSGELRTRAWDEFQASGFARAGSFKLQEEYKQRMMGGIGPPPEPIKEEPEPEPEEEKKKKKVVAPARRATY